MRLKYKTTTSGLLKPRQHCRKKMQRSGRSYPSSRKANLTIVLNQKIRNSKQHDSDRSRKVRITTIKDEQSRKLLGYQEPSTCERHRVSDKLTTVEVPKSLE